MDAPDVAEVERITGGRYAVERLVATGGMGAVYLGRHKILESQVAIKILPSDIAEHEVLLTRFKREAALAAKLSHPNVVPVFEFSVGENLPFLIMPFIEGRTLQEVVAQNGPMNLDDTLDMIREVGSAIEFAHQHEVIHRDIKPSNVLLELGSDRWLITDFGVAHVTSEVDTAITQSGAAIGTPAYMAPEQLGNAGRVDARSDLYSLALIAVEALSGSRPDPLSTVSELAAGLKAARPDLRSDVVRALVAPLAHSPGQRPASVAEWMDSLDFASRSRANRAVRTVAAAAIAGLAALWFWPTGDGGTTTSTNVGVLPFRVTGTPSEIDLSEVLPLAFDWHVQQLPDHRIVGAAAVRDAELRRFGSATPAIADRLDLVTGMGATDVVEGWADVADDSVTLRITIHRPGGDDPVSFQRAGQIDGLDALVSELVVESFASRLAAEWSGVTSAALPSGTEAISAYFAADQDFREADYDGAIRNFDRVARLDPSYGLAPVKRAFTQVLSSRPTEATDELVAAVVATAELDLTVDPGYAALLDGYRQLFADGDVAGAGRTFREVVSRHPDLIDAWFVLGLFQYRMGALLDIPLAEARRSLHEVLARDPRYAPAEANLALIAMNLGDRAGARRHIDRYLQIDSVSDWAALARSADSLVFAGPISANNIIATFDERPDRYLEMVAFAGAEIDPPGGARAVAESAAREMWSRADTPSEIAVAFRILMAYHIGAARHESATRFFNSASRRLDPVERDRWIILSQLSDIPELAPRTAAVQAARRIVSSSDDYEATDLWLALRLLDQNRDNSTEAARNRLTGMSAADPLAHGLAADLEARDLLAEGDTAAALQRWDEALTRFSVGPMYIGLLESLWPVRLAYSNLALAAGDYETVDRVTGTFMRMASVLDQLGWTEAIRIRAGAATATGDVPGAAGSFVKLLRIVERPDGTGSLVKENLQQAYDGLSQPR